MEKADKAKILIVDDKQENLLAMELLFEDESCGTLTAASGNDALGLMVNNDFAMVLMDVQMPGMDGFETAALMRSSSKTGHIPIIFVTAINKDSNHIFKGYESGAVDYIFKPVDPLILKSKARIFLRLYDQQRNLEEANRKIIEQQKSVLEEERLKVLLEMAGATAHELNQPLMALLGSIELIGMCKDEPAEISKSLTRIKDSGKRISEVIKKIQNIRHYDVKAHDSETQVINLDQVTNILHVEESDDDFDRMKEIFINDGNIKLFRAKSISEGMRQIHGGGAGRFHMIFLDFMLVDGTGFDFLERLEQGEYDIPVIMVTEQKDEIIAAQLIQAGASEYLSKNRLTYGELSMVIQKAQTRQRLKMDLKRMQERLVETSVKDELTGLYNRRFFMDSLTVEFQRATRYKRSLSMLLIDVDHFKSINDSLGHLAGDEVLSQIAKLLASCLRSGDLIGRYGGEEFAVLLTETDMDGAFQVGEKMRQYVMDMTFKNIRIPLTVTISIGVTTNQYEETVLEMIETADKAMYLAKDGGRNRVEKLTRE